MHLGKVSRAFGLLSSSGLIAKGAAQACVTTTAAASFPINTGIPLALHEYSYCGGTLTVSVFIEVESVIRSGLLAN